MVGECAHGIDDGRFLSSSRSGGRDEDAGIFAPQAPGLPLLTGAVPESLPLRGEVAISGRDAEKEAVVVLEDITCDEGNVG